jgi:hypothetical protein
MSRTCKTLLLGGLLSWPLLYVLAMVAVLVLDPSLLAPPRGVPVPFVFKILLVLHLATMLETGIALVVCALRLFVAADLSPESKRRWVMGLVAGSIFALPVYWYLRVWIPTRQAGRVAKCAMVESV